MNWDRKDLIKVLNLAGIAEADADEKLLALADEYLSRTNRYTEAAEMIREVLTGEAIFQ